MSRKAIVKRVVQRDLRRASNAEEAQEIVAELEKEVEAKVQEFKGKRIPGTIVGGTKVAYNYSDLVAMFPIVSFIPQETIPLTFQGVQVYAISSVEMHVPKCFKDIYDRHVREKSRPNKLPEMGYFNTIELGAGALPPRETE